MLGSAVGARPAPADGDTIDLRDGRPHRLLVRSIPSSARWRRLAGWGRPAFDLAVAAAIAALLTLPAGRRGSAGAVAAIASGVAWVVLLHLFELYRPRYRQGYEAFRRLLCAWASGTLLFVAIAAQAGPSVRDHHLLAIGAGVAAAASAHAAASRAGRSAPPAPRGLIVGDADGGRRLLQRFGSDPGVVVVGIALITPDPAPDDLPVLGGVAEIETILSEHPVDLLLVSPETPPEALLRLCVLARRRGLAAHIPTSVPDFLSGGFELEAVGPAAMLSLRRTPLAPVQAAAKRVIDLAVAAVAIVVTAPVLAAVALAVRWSSSGPVIFTQERITKDGRTFRVLKFRTMAPDADRLPDGALIDLTAPFFKLEDDPRLTPVGRVLRRFSLDELPQLWNVLKGEMSLVGPRPLPVDQVLSHPDLLTARHEVRAGMTGWWQVTARGQHEPYEANRLDLFYVNNWRLSLDVYILLRTIGAVVSGRGAS